MASRDELQRRSIAAIAHAVTQWTPGIKPRWKISEVRTALRLHSEGDFSQSALLVDAMGEDDTIPGLLEKLVDAVLKEDFCLDPVERPNRKLSKTIAREIEPVWWDMYPEAELDELIRWYRMLGVGIAVQDWKKDANRWTPALRTLHPQFLWRDEFQKKWFYSAQEGVLEVTPGDGTWVLLTDGQRGWMRGLVRPAAIPWIGKQLTIRDQGRYNERHGLPIVKAIVPAIADEGDKDEFWEDLKGLASETTVELLTHVDGTSKDARYDLELLEAKDDSHAAFISTLDRWDRRLTILFLGGNQSTEVNAGTGTNASARQHSDELVDKACAIEKRLSTQLRKQALWPCVAFNYEGASLDVVPWPHWDVEPPEETKAEAEDQEAFGKALKAVQDAGYDVENVEELAEKHGLKIVKRAAVPSEPSTPASSDDEEDPETDPEEEDDEEPEQDTATRGAVGAWPTLASGAAAESNRGFLEGQLFVDALVANSTTYGNAALKPTLDALLEELDAATDYDDLRERLRRRYEGLSAEDLSDLMYRTMLVAELAGRRAVTQDS